MLARLRENLSFKILALTVAILLHMYVSNQQNPSQTRQFTVPLSTKDSPAGLIVTNKPGTVMVTLSGASEELARISDMNINATVDLRHAAPGANTGLPVDVEIAPGTLHSGVTVYEVKPRTVNVQLVERRRRRMPISVDVPAAASSGMVVQKPTVIAPSMATATGPANEVDVIDRLVIRPDVTNTAQTIDDDFRVLPVDSHGNVLADVQVSPEMAHVQVNISEGSRTKDVFVTPKITGVPAPGYIIGSVIVKPASIAVSGSADQLSAVTSLSTEPIDIQGATTTVTKDVKCVAPAGTTAPATPLSVTIQINSVIAPPQPAPAATPQTP